MKDKQARALAIVALVFMGIFVVALIVTLVDHTLLHGSIGYIALGSAVFALMIFAALKADGRGYSVTKMNNEIEMEKIEKALAEQAERERAQAQADGDVASDADKTEANASAQNGGDEVVSENGGGEAANAIENRSGARSADGGFDGGNSADEACGKGKTENRDLARENGDEPNAPANAARRRKRKK